MQVDHARVSLRADLNLKKGMNNSLLQVGVFKSKVKNCIKEYLKFNDIN